MYPVKVYDKHGKLVREYTQEELQERSDKMLFEKKPRGMNWRKSALVKKEMKQRSETNNELFAYKGDKQCKSVPLNLKSGEVPHSGKSKDTTGEPEKE